MTESEAVFQIRSVETSEAPHLAALGAELFIETFGHLYSQRNLQLYLDKVHSPEAVLSDMNSGRVYWLAEQRGKSIGFCKAGPVGVPVDIGSTKSAELKQLYVRKEFHGRGVAPELMAKFFQWVELQQAQDVYVSCWSENHRALAFYHRYGFFEVGSYIFWVGDHQDDERILKLSLPKNGPSRT